MKAGNDDARAEILLAIRRALGRDAPLNPGLARALASRAAQPHPRPHYNAGLAQRFAQKLRAADGGVDFADNNAEIAARVDAYLARHNLGTAVALAPDRRLDRIPWPAHWQAERRNARPGDGVGITPAFAAIAETGSVALAASAQTPAALNLLPATHIVIVEEKQIVPYMEDVWQLLRAANHNPRALFFITGPSRTADIEQTLQLGAHGPTRFFVVVGRGRGDFQPGL